MGFTPVWTWLAGVLTVPKMNEQVRDNIDFLKENIALEAAVELTIAAGVVTKTKAFHKIDTEADAATDDLDEIEGGTEGDVIFIRAENAARIVTVKPGTGADDINCGDDIILSTTEHLVLIRGASYWNVISSPHRTREFTINAFQYPNPGTDWTPEAKGAGLAASLVGKYCWLPLNFLKIGDYIVSYKLVGDAVAAAAITLDCKLVRVDKADPLATTDVAGGAITQVNVDGNFDSLATLTAIEIVATDKQYTLEILGTTGIGDAITVMGAEVKVIRLI